MSDRYEVTEDLQHYEQEDDTTPLVTEESLSSLAILGDTDYNGVTINDIDGITVTSAKNKITFNASKGIEISKLSDGKVIFSVDSNTGDGVFSGQIKASSFDIEPYDIGNGDIVDVNLNYIGLQTSQITGTSKWQSLVQQGMLWNKKYTSNVLKYEMKMDAWSINYKDYQGFAISDIQQTFSPSGWTLWFNDGFRIKIDDIITMYRQLNIEGNDSLLRFNATVNSYQEWYIGTTRYGWLGYSSANPTTLSVRNEQGDISITPKATTNKINLVGVLDAVAYADFDSGTTSITTVANTVVSKAITFGKTFASVPNVVVGANSAFPNEVQSVTVGNVTTTGCTIYVHRTNATTMNIYWLASIA